MAEFNNQKLLSKTCWWSKRKGRTKLLAAFATESVPEKKRKRKTEASKLYLRQRCVKNVFAFAAVPASKTL